MSILSKAQWISETFDVLELNEDLCLNSISPKAKCTRCKDICQHDGIDLEEFYLKRSCISCGLCASVCPTGAIRLKYNSEEGLHQRLTEKIENKEDINISCWGNLKSENEDAIYIHCLSNIPLELICLMLVNGEKIYFPNSACSKCEYKDNLDYFYQKYDLAKETLDKLNIKYNDFIKNKSKKRRSKKSGFSKNKRNFMTSFANEIKKIPVNEINKFLGFSAKEEKEDSKIKDKSYSFDLIKNLLEENNIKEDISMGLKEYPKINGKCYDCKICQMFCPSQAVSKDQDKLIIDYKNCISCGLCESLCYAKGIEMEEDRTLDYKKRYETEDLLTKECKSCGRIFRSNNQETCQKCF